MQAKLGNRGAMSHLSDKATKTIWGEWLKNFRSFTGFMRKGKRAFDVCVQRD